jgi:hypothetical protein
MDSFTQPTLFDVESERSLTEAELEDLRQRVEASYRLITVSS